MSPLQHRHGLIRFAREEGATVVAGRDVPIDSLMGDGLFVQPTSGQACR